MAQIIETDIEPQIAGVSKSLLQSAIIGLILGVVYFGLTALIDQIIIGQIFCKGNTDSILCSRSLVISGDIATILVATLGIGLMLRLYMARPLIVSLATAVSLWGLSKWTDGLGWFEILAWSSLLYIVSYLLFSWIVRYMKVVPVFVVVALIVIVTRVSASL